MVTHLQSDASDFADRLAQIVAARRQPAPDIAQGVAEILAQVCQHGDDALRRYTAQWDHHTLPDTFALSEEQKQRARAACDPALRRALERAAERIRAYHSQQLPRDHRYRDAQGVALGWRWTPVDAAGFYVCCRFYAAGKVFHRSQG